MESFFRGAVIQADDWGGNPRREVPPRAQSPPPFGELRCIPASQPASQPAIADRGISYEYLFLTPEVDLVLVVFGKAAQKSIHPHPAALCIVHILADLNYLVFLVSCCRCTCDLLEVLFNSVFRCHCGMFNPKPSQRCSA
jgi:hypothetical protein